ncbi:hypothetical protein PIB30_067268 [Stylosanthes scabra]|uniref:Uncharacterized protein n=1 Tax=Stylosanthes scabra TaxID=79078 RepID=A0ABU6WKU0_9FABA|nr:hypothetical protein [Stylosanthes scabra]
MAGEVSSRKGTKLPCRRSQRIAALHRAKSQASEEHEVIALSSDSEIEKDGNLEANAKGAWEELKSVLNNWGKIEPSMGPARNDQGPPPAAN